MDEPSSKNTVLFASPVDAKQLEKHFEQAASIATQYAALQSLVREYLEAKAISDHATAVYEEAREQCSPDWHALYDEYMAAMTATDELEQALRAALPS